MVLKYTQLLIGCKPISIRLKPELLQKHEKPLFLLANSPKLFDMLQGMLLNRNQDICCEIWKLLEELPASEFYLSRMKNLPQTNPDWNEYLQLNPEAIIGKHAYCCYILKLILEQLISQPEKLKFYLQGLKNLNGYEFFLDLLKKSLKEARTKISLKCITYSSYCVNVFIKNGEYKNIFPEIKEKKAIWSELDKINKEILNCCNIKGGALDKILSVKEQCELLGNLAFLQILIASINPDEFRPELLNEKYFQVLKQGLFNANNEFREKICEILMEIWEENVVGSQIQHPIAIIYSDLLFGIFLEQAIESSERALNYFALLKNIIVNTECNVFVAKISRRSYHKYREAKAFEFDSKKHYRKA